MQVLRSGRHTIHSRKLKNRGGQVADNYDQYSKEELLRLLRERDRKPKFGLVWERNEIEHDKSLNDDFVALDFDPALSCGDAPFENLIIEGDNFDALRYLRMTHAGRVNCIYIDPPYNTGNRDFIYNDHFVDKDDAYRHSKWLEFMYRRLTLAKDLLAEDGVIFISIDDNEFAELKLLCDQIFSATRFSGAFVWRRRTPSAMKTDLFSSDHEYVLTYAAPGFRFLGVEKTYEGYANPDDDFRGDWIGGDLTVGMNKDQRPNQFYDLVNPETGRIYPANPDRIWAFIPESMQRMIAEKRIVFPAKKGLQPKLKRFKNELKRDANPVSTWLSEVGLNSEGSREIQAILGGQDFQYPKPSSLIEVLLRASINENDLVLDFFAGSGTTAHAVMKLNVEDGGKRRYILVSSTEATSDAPNKNLCRDVCAERVRRVAQGYTNKKGESVEGLGGSFAYLRTKRIPVSRVFNDMQHEQVWQALQLIHGVPLIRYDQSVLVQLSGNEDDRLVYVPKLSKATLGQVVRLAHLSGRLVVYSWQPGQIKQRVEAPNVAFEKIPEFLVSRFGGMAR
ncbi:MAG: site-specific DNA-methyltransferase [Candidatus Nitrotoga sp.]|nr:site-specific DNA-methyltransferase [Candidatus Nitrotoga sp.]